MYFFSISCFVKAQTTVTNFYQNNDLTPVLANYVKYCTSSE